MADSKAQHLRIRIGLGVAGAADLLLALTMVVPQFSTALGFEVSTPSKLLGGVAALLGFGCLSYAWNPIRRWPLACLALLTRTVISIGTGWLAVAMGAWHFGGLVIVAVQVLGSIPLVMGLYAAFRFASDTARFTEPLNFEEALTRVSSQRGATLGGLSRKAPTLLLFLGRESCCNRQLLEKIVTLRKGVWGRRATTVIVHMASPMAATQLLARYGLDDLHRFSDPECRLYRAFQLPRVGLWHSWGPPNWLPYFRIVARSRQVAGSLAGDPFRMQGAYVLRDGKLAATFCPEVALQPFDAEDLLRRACSPPPREQATVDGCRSTEPSAVTLAPSYPHVLVRGQTVN